jgi:hypothetical protein
MLASSRQGTTLAHGVTSLDEYYQGRLIAKTLTMNSYRQRTDPDQLQRRYDVGIA